MHQITVVSGKGGGTGKTTLVACFAALAGSAVVADCDVDAANLALVLGPTRRRETHEFWASQKATIDPENCTSCGNCRVACREKAIRDGFWVDALACTGCGVCFHVCPQQAITMQPSLSGYWYVSDTPYGVLVHARLQPGSENSVRLVTVVREQARRHEEAHARDLVIMDGLPGIGCPVMASITGASCALVVTEPTRSGPTRPCAHTRSLPSLQRTHPGVHQPVGHLKRELPCH